jgi:hypothetical protein
MCYVTLGFIGAWTVASVFAIAFQCHLPSPWAFGGDDCVDQFALNIGIHALNIATDMLLVVIPFVMMQQVQISTGKRWVVTGLFGSRLMYVC